VIYLDTSVILAQLLAEDRVPPARMWDDVLVASRLIEYELWNRLHARGLTATHGEDARNLLSRVAMLELHPNVLARALEPFPTPLRTLDALHLASVDFLRSQRQAVELATYDRRMITAARKLRMALYVM
jgi:predicted nucleic acid-binding protein